MLWPILFTVYIDDHLRELERQGIGCYWNKHFFGAVCYPDDILAPSPTAALRLMLTQVHKARVDHKKGQYVITS